MLTLVGESVILNIQERQLLHTHKDIYSQKNEWKLQYRASRDGDTAKNFHKHCDGLSPICVIIKSKEYDHVFGGFSFFPFDGQKYGYTDDPEFKNWIFLLRFGGKLIFGDCVFSSETNMEH